MSGRPRVMRRAALALALAAAACTQRPAAAAALATGAQCCTPLKSTMALWAVAAAAQPAAAGSPLDAFMATSGGAAEAAPSLGGKFHGEYNKAIVDLFAKRAGLRKSVPPDVLGPFVEAAALTVRNAHDPEPTARAAPKSGMGWLTGRPCALPWWPHRGRP